MMNTSNTSWNANTPWDSSNQNQSQQQPQSWNQSYNSVSAMHPPVPPPSVSSQYNQFAAGFGSQSWSNQRSSLPSPNMNHQFLGINGSSTSGKDFSAKIQTFHN